MKYVLILSENLNINESKYKDVKTLKFSSCNDFFSSLSKINLNSIEIFLIDIDMEGTGKAIDIIKVYKSKNSKIIPIK